MADKEQMSSNTLYKGEKAPKRVNSVGLDEFAICGYFSSLGYFAIF